MGRGGWRFVGLQANGVVASSYRALTCLVTCGTCLHMFASVPHISAFCITNMYLVLYYKHLSRLLQTCISLSTEVINDSRTYHHTNFQIAACAVNTQNFVHILVIATVVHHNILVIDWWSNLAHSQHISHWESGGEGRYDILVIGSWWERAATTY